MFISEQKIIRFAQFKKLNHEKQVIKHCLCVFYKTWHSFFSKKENAKHKKQNIMKTKTTLTVIAALFVAIAGLNAANSNENDEVTLSKEAYVNDVPFDTEAIVANFDGDKDKKNQSHDVKLSEEEYVNDVNINTRQVILEHFTSFWHKTKKIAGFLSRNLDKLSEQGYINQNTINLSKIYNEIIEEESDDVKLKEESYVDDVPFDTAEIVK